MYPNHISQLDYSAKKKKKKPPESNIRKIQIQCNPFIHSSELNKVPTELTQKAS